MEGLNIGIEQKVYLNLFLNVWLDRQSLLGPKANFFQ